MDKAGVKEITKKPTISRNVDNSGKATKLIMSDNGCPDEVISPKPKIVRAPKKNILRTVTFAESASSTKSPNKSTVVEHDANNEAMKNLDDVELGENDKMLHNEAEETSH